jgi:hypothetical protein
MVGAVTQPATNEPDEHAGWLLVRDDGVIVAANEPAAALLDASSTEGLGAHVGAAGRRRADAP